jgi:uncharacterized membrane protein
MILLSVMGYLTINSAHPEYHGRVRTGREAAILIAPMILPFTYNIFNPTLNHFINISMRNEIRIAQVVASIWQIGMGIVLLITVIKLEDRAFREIFK